MTTSQKSPLLKAAGLWAKSSPKGGQYLTGRLGGVKVLVLENRDRQGDDDPSHILYVTEAPERRPGGQDRGSRAGDTPAPLRRNGPPLADKDHPEQQCQSPPASDSFDDRPPWER